MSRTQMLALHSALLASLVFIGCSRPPELAFSASEDSDELAESHRQQIEERLVLFFGTPVNPLLRVAEGEVDEDTSWDDLKLVDAIEPDRLKRGAAVFNRRCAGCHGVTGDGKGEVAEFLVPKPRDYRRGVYKFTSTPYGGKPSRKDLIRVIRRGAKGTSMPAFKFLPDQDVQDLVDYVIMLSHRGQLEYEVKQWVLEEGYEEEDEVLVLDFTDSLIGIREAWTAADYDVVLPVSAQPKMTDETILAGRKAFLSKGCSKCHGENFKGQMEWLALSKEAVATELAKKKGEAEGAPSINFDAWDEVAPAADATAGMLHGGRRSIDIYRRLYTGINGTPMPAFGDSLAEEPETLWHLVHYVLSVLEQRQVEGMADVVAEPVEGTGD